MSNLPPERIGRNETRTLTDFFTSSSTLQQRCLVQAVSALQTLALLPSFGLADAIQVCQSLFDNVDMPVNVQSTRLLVFRLIDTMMAHHRRALKRMGNTFLSGYCKLATGEKDPRNLRLAFSIARVILVEFDIAERVEDLFDITFCYFPITFTPPPGDPYGISSEDLQTALRACLSATPRFGPLALPLFLDKLQAAVPAAKQQTLRALSACFPVYGHIIVQEHARTFWEAFSVEVFHATETETEECALDALVSLLNTMHAESIDEGKDTVAQRMINVCCEELNEPDKQKAQAAIKILSAALTSSPVIISVVTSRAFRHLIRLCSDLEEPALRPAVLKSLASLLTSIAQTDAAQHVASPVLLPLKDDLISLFGSGMRFESSRLSSIDGLVQLTLIRDLLPKNEVAFVVQQLNEVFIDTSASGASNLALAGMVRVAKLHAGVIEHVTLPVILSALPTTADVLLDPEAVVAYRHALGALSSLCLDGALFEMMTIRVLARLEVMLPQVATRPCLTYCHHLLLTLSNVLATKAARGDVDIAHHTSRLISSISRIFVVPNLSNEKVACASANLQLLQDAGRVIELIVRSHTVEDQKNLSLLITAAYQGDYTPLIDQTDKRMQVEFDPLCHAAQSRCLILLAYAQLSLRPEALLLDLEPGAFVQQVLSAALHMRDPTILRAASQLLACVVNKLRARLDPSVLLQFEATWLELRQRSAHSAQSLRLFGWLTRALVVRGDPEGYKWTDRLLATFVEPEIGREAAKALAIIPDDTDEMLSRESFAVIKMLYRQRYCTYVLRKLMSAYPSAQGEAQNVLLIALSSLLKHVPQQICVSESPNLMPMLLSALEVTDDELLANVLDTFAMLALTAPESVIPHVSILVNALIRSCTLTAKSDSATAAAARISALKCLAAFPDMVPYLKLHPQKATVLRALGKAVDDPRKPVRKAAVDCRSKWYKYTS
ncbi:uncharacterized protein L969DRAFT_90937 [Mixia osmundae IAM 14324]|nr:uncharacterized protein L969DRAFT_90937 [Mixia osmundae IAM 14324]KEI36566.1 hypothetical protein L969DRAFT_90937 [Mixia osmundae IAM 14324]